MGRHSAPDDAADDAGDAGDVAAAQPTLALAPDAELTAVIKARGRHSRGDDTEGAAEPSPDLDQTQRISIISDAPPAPEPPFALDLHTITEPAPDEPVELVPQEEQPSAAERKAARRAARKAAKAERESDTRADLRLLRQNPAVRAQAIGAVIATFLVYTVVMIVLGRTTDYLMWLWLPIVVAGVLVGLVLDLAHRRIAKRAVDDGPGGQDLR